MARLIKTTNQFEKQLRLMGKRGKDLTKLQAIIQRLASDEPLQPRHRDHQLTGHLADFRECHIEPDWLLVYRLGTLDDKPAIFLVGTGTHADLFG
jgi:mRNA interferase YafQ